MRSLYKDEQGKVERVFPCEPMVDPHVVYHNICVGDT